MSGMIRIFFPLIGYFCVATVITLAAGYGYLRSNGTLNDETMFQIVSLIHGIDLDEIADANQTDEQDVPHEEMSFEDHQIHLRMNVLHMQSKQNDIAKNIEDFKAVRAQLGVDIAYYSRFRNEVETYLKQKLDESKAAGLAGVREHWKNLNAKKQTKELLIRMIKNDEMDTVIDILNGLNANTVKEILKTLDTPDDLDILQQIEAQMLSGGPEADFIENKLDELNQGGVQ